MRDIGAIIWGILVVIGVISSIVQSAKRARGTRGVPASFNSQVNRSAGTPARTQTQVQQPVRTGAQQQMNPQLAALMRQFEQQAQAVTQAAAPQPPPPPKPPTPPKKAPPPVQPTVAVQPVAAPRRHRGGIAAFGDRDSLVRAVVAAEVLGKPLALRDE